MATVPKLNYANLRNKSKTKDNELSDRMKQGQGNDLFSHMNQDNLKYIQNQIKQKNKKSNPPSIKANINEEQMPTQPKSYPDLIEEKQSMEEETERGFNDRNRQELNIFNTEGESMQNNDSEGKRKSIEEPQNHKLSYYDVISQAKSKRISSIEAYFEQQGGDKKKGENFANFLEQYIVRLSKKEKKQFKFRTPNENNSHRSSVIDSFQAEREILIKGLNEEKKKNVMFAKQIEKHRISEIENKKRIQNLENAVTMISEQLEAFKKEFRAELKQKNLTRSAGLGLSDMRSGDSRVSYQQPLNLSTDKRFLKKSRQHADVEEILQLERQRQIFEETGQFV